jgi:hypothetical protein
MKELKKDLFKCIFDPDVEAICITTNGNFTRNGLAIMGGGCAKVAADKWPEVPKKLGKLLRQFGTNVPFVIGAVDKDANHINITRDMIRNKEFKCLIFSYPTINNLINGANLQLIKQSATIMVDYANQFELKNIVIGRMGVGIGGLLWADVKPEVENILDDRFTIVSFDHEE